MRKYKHSVFSFQFSVLSVISFFIFLISLFIIPTSAYAVVDGDNSKAQFVLNQVIVKYKNGQSPADLQRAVNEELENSKTISGRVSNFINKGFMIINFILNEETDQNSYSSQLSQIEQVKINSKVIDEGKPFELDVLGDGPPPQLQDIYLYTTDGSFPVESILKDFASLPQVEFVQPSYILETLILPNDPYYQQEYQWNFAKIGMEEAWRQITSLNIKEVTTAVLDTGVDFNHEDFLGQSFIPGRDFAWCDYISDDGMCCDIVPDYPRCKCPPLSPDDPRCELMPTPVPKQCPGLDDLYCDNDPQDDEGHGTFVSGIINAVTNNATGVAGIGWAGVENYSEMSILPIKVMNKYGQGADIWVAMGIVHAVENGADIINLSLGRQGKCSEDDPIFGEKIMQRAIDHARENGVTVVVAAGNKNQNAADTTPASCDGVIVVGATGKDDERALYSNFGSIVDLAAPGGNVTEDRDPSDNNQKTSLDCIVSECILSTHLKNPLNTFPAEKYAIFQGTSASTPHVAGAAAMLLSSNPSLTPDQIEQILKDSGDPLPDVSSNKPIGKRLNFAKALSVIGENTNITPTPTVTPGGATLTPSPTITPGGPTLTPTPTTRIGGPDGASPTPRPTLSPHPCEDQAKQGNYDCQNGINKKDYDKWLDEYLNGRTTLEYFEYWRRAFLGNS